jgi:hypothetical protein
MELVRCPVSLRHLDPISDPSLDIGPPVPHVLAHPKANRTFSSVPPCVQGLDRDVKERREIVGRQEAFGVGHASHGAYEPCRESVKTPLIGALLTARESMQRCIRNPSTISVTDLPGMNMS